MLTALLTVLLAAPDAGVVVWRFPNPGSDALMAAVVAARGDDPTHRVTNDEIEETLRQPAALGGCLEDARACTEPALDALAMFDVRARVDASSGRDGAVFTVKLVVAPTVGGEPRTVSTRGPTLAVAVSAAFADLRGESGVRVSVKPDDATVWIDDVQVGQGSGHYSAAPGAHRVRVEAPGYTSLQQTADVKVGATEVLTFEMASADGQVLLSIEPPEATVKIDGKPVVDWKLPLSLAPSTYQITIEAPGHVAHTQPLTVKQATRHDLKVKLPKQQPSWQEALRSPHPDTVARDGYLRADIRFASVFDGPVGLASGRDAERVVLENQDDSVGLLGVNLGAGWRQRYWFVEALSLSIDAGGDTGAVTLSTGNEGRIEGLTRVTLKPAWIGARYPAWRFDPYIAVGFVVVFESFDLVVAEGDTRAMSNRLLEFGLEFGVRYALSDTWFLSMAGGFEFWPDERTSGAVLLGAGWALDLPEWL